MDHLMAAIEDIVGQTMGNYHLRDKFKYYNNKYLRPILTRESGNAEPKIFETYSKLNVADAMNLVKQNNSNLMPGTTNNGLGVSLSSIFRSYTQTNLNKSPPEEKTSKNINDIPRNNSSFLNVDIAELEYSPSTKDLADAQLHHILSDAMFKPPRKRYISRTMYDRDTSSTPDPQTRLQFRHLMDERIPHRRLSSHVYTSNQKSSVPNNNNNNVCSNSEKSLGSNSSDGQNTKGLINGRKKHSQPLPKLRFSMADDPSSEYEVPTPMPTQTGAAMEEPMSNYSSLLDVSSTYEDDGITFTAHTDQRTPSPQQQSDTKDGTSESDSDDESSLRSAPPKTITELTLPWKRDVETGVGDSSDSESFVHRQQEFPSWIENKEYLVHGSPTNTLLSRLGNNSKRVSAPAVFEIFNETMPKSETGAASPARRRSQDSINVNSTRQDSDDEDFVPATNFSSTKFTKVTIEPTTYPKDVVIEIKVNGKNPPISVINDCGTDDNNADSQATRL